MCSHELIESKLEYQILTSRKIGNRALGVPKKIPHPSTWNSLNGFKVAYEKDIKFKKIDPVWVDFSVPDVPQPEVKSLFSVLDRYDSNVAKLYNSFMRFK
jgi:hypothetical protein